jgi:hypothetical protein
MDILNTAEEYRRARAAFLGRCRELALDVVSHCHPLPGPDGASIYSDVVRIGPANAGRTLLVVSGNHGVEGYAGSEAQSALLGDLVDRALPSDTNVMILHMLNPWGAAWRRRHNEDNVDLNRHFVDRADALPANPAHAELDRFGFFESLGEASPDDALALLAAFKEQHGEASYGQAVFQGQYDRADGLGFGGQTASWSYGLLEQVGAQLAASKTIALVDLHTGLGPFGLGTAICTEPAGSADTTVLRGWYREPFVALLEDRQGLPYELQGDLANAIRKVVPGSRVLSISLEFGTYPSERFAELMVRDAWAQRQLDPTSPEVEAVRCDLAHFFYPRSAQWRAMVAVRTRAVAAMALAGLGEAAL